MMTKGKAIEILSKAFSSVFYEITPELEQKKVDIEREILMSNSIEKIKSLVEELNDINTALRDIDYRKDHVVRRISDADNWCDFSLLCELDRAFSWLPNKGEAE